MNIQSLTAILREEFERRNFLSRTHEAVCAIQSEKSNAISALAISLLSGSALVGGGLCWLTLEGAVRSCIDLAEDSRYIVRLRALGDAGGWTSLALFSVLALKAVYEGVIHEGEYIRFKEICQQWLEERDQAFKEEVYPLIYDSVKALSTRCMFVKSVSAKIFGIAFPILFMINFVLSVVGEVGLGKEIFVDREDLTAIGHFGEWPINAIEAAVTAYLLYRWYIGTETAIDATKQVYQDNLEGLEPELQERLREVGSEEIKQLAGSSAYLQLPTDHEIDELTERLELL